MLINVHLHHICMDSNCNSSYGVITMGKVHDRNVVKKMAKSLTNDWLSDFWKQNNMEPQKFLLQEINVSDHEFKWVVILEATFNQMLIFKYEYWPEFHKEILTPYYPMETLNHTYNKEN